MADQRNKPRLALIKLDKAIRPSGIVQRNSSNHHHLAKEDVSPTPDLLPTDPAPPAEGDERFRSIVLAFNRVESASDAAAPLKALLEALELSIQESAFDSRSPHEKKTLLEFGVVLRHWVNRDETLPQLRRLVQQFLSRLA